MTRRAPEHLGKAEGVPVKGPMGHLWKDQWGIFGRTEGVPLERPKGHLQNNQKETFSRANERTKTTPLEVPKRPEEQQGSFRRTEGKLLKWPMIHLWMDQGYLYKERMGTFLKAEWVPLGGL